jgi:hypothetical protein
VNTGEARHYRGPVRKRSTGRVVACTTILLVVLGAAACSQDSEKTSDTPKESPCPLIERLDATAAKVARADVSDPDRFDKALTQGVETYVATVKQLQDLMPSEMRPDLERMEAAVNQYRFNDVADARAALDTYAAAHCAPTATTAPPASSVPPTTAAGTT